MGHTQAAASFPAPDLLQASIILSSTCLPAYLSQEAPHSGQVRPTSGVALAITAQAVPDKEGCGQTLGLWGSDLDFLIYLQHDAESDLFLKVYLLI